MNKNILLSIAKDFCETPGLRYKSESNNSAELFRETVLEPKFREARDKHVKLEVDLNGTKGYASSFLEESFGGLARIHGIDTVQANVLIYGKDVPSFVEEANEYIAHAND